MITNPNEVVGFSPTPDFLVQIRSRGLGTSTPSRFADWMRIYDVADEVKDWDAPDHADKIDSAVFLPGVQAFAYVSVKITGRIPQRIPHSDGAQGVRCRVLYINADGSPSSAVRAWMVRDHLVS